MYFLELKRHNRAFRLLLTDSRQSQLHFGTIVACVDKLQSNLASKSCEMNFS